MNNLSLNTKKNGSSKITARGAMYFEYTGVWLVFGNEPISDFEDWYFKEYYQVAGTTRVRSFPMVLD